MAGSIAGCCALHKRLSQVGNPRYDTHMKPPPEDAEFTRFTDAMQKIVKVSKDELKRRMEAEKRTPRAIASRAFRARPKRAV